MSTKNCTGDKVSPVQLYWEGKWMERAMDFLTTNGIGGSLCIQHSEIQRYDHRWHEVQSLPQAAVVSDHKCILAFLPRTKPRTFGTSPRLFHRIIIMLLSIQHPWVHFRFIFTKLFINTVKYISIFGLTVLSKAICIIFSQWDTIMVRYTP